VSRSVALPSASALGVAWEKPECAQRLTTAGAADGTCPAHPGAGADYPGSTSGTSAGPQGRRRPPHRTPVTGDAATQAQAAAVAKIGGTAHGAS
jgi:hypothetical protein